jgi:hypothetical protein
VIQTLRYDPDVVFDTFTRTEVAGYPALRSTFSYPASYSASNRAYILYYLFLKDDELYTLNYVARFGPATYDERLPDAQVMIDSLTFDVQ